MHFLDPPRALGGYLQGYATMHLDTSLSVPCIARMAQVLRSLTSPMGLFVQTSPYGMPSRAPAPWLGAWSLTEGLDIGSESSQGQQHALPTSLMQGSNRFALPG